METSRHRRPIDRQTLVAKILGVVLLLVPVVLFLVAAATLLGFWWAVLTLLLAAAVFAIMWVGAALLLD